MHTKTATLALFALIAASNAAPLSDRRSWSQQTPGLSRRANPSCSDKATTNSKTEGDCANTPNATGFKAGAVTAACNIPVKGSGEKGICYVGVATVAQRRSPEDDPTDPPAPEGSDGKEPSESTDQPPEPSETPEKQPQAASPCPETPSQSPIDAPPADASPSSKSPAPAATTTTPSAPPSQNAGPGKQIGKGVTQPGDVTWIGKSLFKFFGGLF